MFSVLLLLFRLAFGQEAAPLPTADFEGEVDRETREGTSQRVLAQFHLSPPNALLQIATTNCKEEELYLLAELPRHVLEL